MKEKKVALMQPCYLPWLGHFHLWACADEIIWLDTFQYSRSSYHSRNRIKAPNAEGWRWVTVPVENHLGDNLLHAVPSASSPWRRKHTSAIRTEYAHAPFRQCLEPLLEWIDDGEFTSLAALNIGILERVRNLLKLPTPSVRASELGLTAVGRSERVKEILDLRQASHYLAARGSVSYMVEDGGWENSPIELLVQDFHCPTYPQTGRETFLANLSVIDALANIGPAGIVEVLNSRRGDWVPFRAVAEELTKKAVGG